MRTLRVMLALGLLVAPLAAQEMDEFTVMPPLGFNFPGGKPLDILGIYPGMPLEKAKPIVTQHTDRVAQQTKIYARAAERQTIDPITRKRYAFFFGGGEDGDVRRRPMDNLAVIASSTTADNQVLAVGRQLSFNIGEQPPARATYDSLIKKYGKVAFSSASEARDHGASPPAGLDANSVPVAPQACSAFVWYFSEGKAPTGFNYDPDFGEWSNLLDHYQTREQLTARLADFYLQMQGNLTAGVRLYAAMCNGEVAGRLSGLTLTMTDISRASSALAVEQDRLDAIRREQEFQKQQAPAGQVPKL